MTDVKPIPIEAQPGAAPLGRARATLIRRLIDVVSTPASSVAPQDRCMAADVLLEMMFEADEEDRVRCAERLRSAREAPKRILRYLCQSSFRVARPVLEENEALDASDLAEAAEAGGPEHRLTIAGRKNLPVGAADALLAAGDLAACQAVLTNRSAALSERMIDGLVDWSREEGSLCELILDRPETTPSQALAMFWWADSALRLSILKRFCAGRDVIIEACEDVFALAAEERWQDPLARKTLQLIERRQRNRLAVDKSPYDSLEHAIEAAASAGMTTETAQEIGYLAGVKPVTIAKILSDPGGEPVAVLCKATGVKRPGLHRLWVAMRRPLRGPDGSPHPLYRQMRMAYDLLTVAKAQTTLRYWNWSLSASFSPAALRDDPDADDGFAASRRTVRLVFGEANRDPA